MKHDLLKLAEQLDGYDYRGVLPALRNLLGWRVTFDGLEFQFWKWGNEFFSATPKQLSSALKARALANGDSDD